MVRTTQNQYTKKNRSSKNGHKDGKAFYKLMNHAIYEKNNGEIEIGNLRNRIDVKLVSNEKDYLKWRSKPS